MQKINFIGNIFGITGYHVHARKLVNALNDIGCDVRIESDKPNQWERLVNDFELNALTKKFDPDSTTIMVSQPHTWPLGLAKKTKKFYGYCIWEGDKIPEYWLQYITDKRVDKILVASKHNRNAILNAIQQFKYIDKNLYNKIEIVPHGVDISIFYPEYKKPDKTLVILANKGWNRGK